MERPIDIIDEHLETVKRLPPDEGGYGLPPHRGQFHDVVAGAEPDDGFLGHH
ncbi:hypothetical protein [Streptomyces sp. NPDC050856]|uniref:hypothetical protein n=1 Tax=Streptomyces sp. NPDC050856 TaxID=3154939 RepID=UPI0033D3370C